MRPFQRALCSTAVAATCLSCSNSPPAVQAHRVIRLMAGQPGANEIVDAITRAFRMTGVELEIQYSPGSLRSVQAVQQGETDVAFSSADVAYLAFAGQLEPATRPFDQLRGIAVLPLSVVHLIARKDSGIRSVSDLKGRHISTGGAGSGSTLSSRLILEAFNLDASMYNSTVMEFHEALGQIVNGQLDAMFVTLRFPDERVMKTIRAGAYLVSIMGPPLEQLRRIYPFYRFALIPGSSYPSHPTVYTTGFDGLLVCRRDLDEATVYEFTKQYFEGVVALRSYKGPPFNLDNAPATPIPLHEGAARFYREEELRR